MPEPDLYEVLGVASDASPAEIRLAYREQAMLSHPDRNPGFQDEATARLTAINRAYEVLRDPDQRAAYDEWANGPPPFADSAPPVPERTEARSKPQQDDSYGGPKAEPQEEHDGSEAASQAGSSSSGRRGVITVVAFLIVVGLVLEAIDQAVNSSSDSTEANVGEPDQRVRASTRKFFIGTWSGASFLGNDGEPAGRSRLALRVADRLRGRLDLPNSDCYKSVRETRFRPMEPVRLAAKGQADCANGTLTMYSLDDDRILLREKSGNGSNYRYELRRRR